MQEDPKKRESAWAENPKGGKLRESPQMNHVPSKGRNILEKTLEIAKKENVTNGRAMKSKKPGANATHKWPDREQIGNGGEKEYTRSVEGEMGVPLSRNPMKGGKVIPVELHDEQQSRPESQRTRARWNNVINKKKEESTCVAPRKKQPQQRKTERAHGTGGGAQGGRGGKTKRVGERGGNLQASQKKRGDRKGKGKGLSNGFTSIKRRQTGGGKMCRPSKKGGRNQVGNVDGEGILIW